MTTMTDEEQKPKKHDEFAVSSCSKAKQRIPNQETWMLLRRAYCEAMGDEEWDPQEWKKDGMKVPNEIRMDPVRGRGVFVTKNIEKGTRVYVAKQTVEFEKREQLVTFLEALPWEYQCDVLLWAYPVEEGEAWVDLDAGSFINHADTEEEINMSKDGFATRDIRKGEALLMNYSEFITYGYVPWFDEIRSAAWDPQYQDGEVHVYGSTDSYNKLGAPGSAVASSNSDGTSLKFQDVFEPCVLLSRPVYLAVGFFFAGIFCCVLFFQKVYFSRMTKSTERRKMS